MKNITLLCVGKLKDKKLIDLEKDYIKRLKNISFSIIELKSFEENINLEQSEILKKIDLLKSQKSIFTVLITENGISFSSCDFSNWLHLKFEQSVQNIVFIVGGAVGFSKEFKVNFDMTLSLSKFTFPHKLARLLIIEQLYRCKTIKENHPYHK